MTNGSAVAPIEESDNVAAVVGERLSLSAFRQLCGRLGGYSFVKVVVDRESATIHFLNNARHAFHAIYIAEVLLGMTAERMGAEIDTYNQRFYHDADRRFLLGILALHTRREPGGGPEKRMFSLETVEVDTMPAELLTEFYDLVAGQVDQAVPLLLKPANQLQERIVGDIPAERLPRVFAHELFSTAPFVPLNPGKTRGRLRKFCSEAEYRSAAGTLEWSDIIVMDRVPDDIPRLSGIVNAQHTTPLSHTNVLATGWQIPNAIQLGALEEVERRGLDGKWVEYVVDASAGGISLTQVDEPAETAAPPAWYAQRITLEEPESEHNPIVNLAELRAADHHRYGTKAANIGELQHVLAAGSPRLLGFFQVARPPRDNLLPYLARLLDTEPGADLGAAARRLLQERVRVPRGIALPFSLQRRFLEASPQIQQAIGKLKMALELGAREVEPLCVELQLLIRSAKMPRELMAEIDAALVTELAGVRSFVVRSSSNAEDLAGFSAAGIYESINHVTTAEKVFASVKEVWASLVSVRSVVLRRQAGISLDECYMGVVIQEQVQADFGGVLVTGNPMNRGDFRNVYVNVSPRVTDVVDGSVLPMQYLYSTVEGGGRTVSLGDASEDLDEAGHAQLQRLAVAGRLLQAHFSPDYTFDSPVDVEWLADREHIHIVQLRPFSL